jgi:hypothetical protein
LHRRRVKHHVAIPKAFQTDASMSSHEKNDGTHDNFSDSQVASSAANYKGFVAGIFSGVTKLSGLQALPVPLKIVL